MQIPKVNKPIVLLWITLTSTAPFIFYTWPGHPYKILTFACLLIMTVQIALLKNRKLIDFKILALIFIQISFYLFAALYHDDISNINLCVQLVSLFIIITYISNFIGFQSFVKSYIIVILVMGIGGTIMFFIHALIGINPIFSVDYSESGTSHFLGLTTTNLYYHVGNLRIIRYSGFFDESGTFALYSIFAILLNRIYFKNWKFEFWLISVTLFTLSLAFYTVIIVFFILFFANKRSFKYLVIIFITISIAYIFINDRSNNQTIAKLYELTFKRLEVNANGLKGDNRAEYSKLDKIVFSTNPLLGVGSSNKLVHGSNLFSILARYGIIGSMFYYSFLLYLLYLINGQVKKQRLIYYKILFLILLNFYHRPEMSSVFTLLVIFSILDFVRIGKAFDEPYSKFRPAKVVQDNAII